MRGRVGSTGLIKAGAALSATLLATAVVSAFWFIRWADDSGWGIAVGQASLVVAWWDPADPDVRPPPGGFDVARHGFPIVWRLHHEPASSHVAVYVPLWIPLVLLVLATTGELCRQHWMRRRLGFCRACGYDTSGLPAGTPCPECGISGAP